MSRAPGTGLAGIYVPDVLLTSTHRKPPPPRTQATEWNWRVFGEDERQTLADGFARGDQHGLDLIAGRTTT